MMPEVRFWSNVDIRGADECWPWMLSLNTHGYGYVRIDGRSHNASRVALEFARGPIGDRMALHSCHNRRCCNPAHLRAGTHAENMADRNEAGRHMVNRGASNGQARLNPELVREIRRRRADGEALKDLAADFCVSVQTICDVAKGRTWAHA